MRLVVRPVAWYPDGPNGCGINVLAFAEEGGRPSIPDPLIRVRAGSPSATAGAKCSRL